MHNCDTPTTASWPEITWLCPECGAGWRLVAAWDFGQPTGEVLVTWQRTSWPARQPD